MAVQLGKRYKDEDTGIEVLVIKPGDCDLKCDERDMELMQPKVLPRPTSDPHPVTTTVTGPARPRSATGHMARDG